MKYKSFENTLKEWLLLNSEDIKAIALTLVANQIRNSHPFWLMLNGKVGEEVMIALSHLRNVRVLYSVEIENLRQNLRKGHFLHGDILLIRNLDLYYVKREIEGRGKQLSREFRGLYEDCYEEKIGIVATATKPKCIPREIRNMFYHISFVDYQMWLFGTRLSEDKEKNLRRELGSAFRDFFHSVLYKAEQIRIPIEVDKEIALLKKRPIQNLTHPQLPQGSIN
jgi:hypothetical protein